jgi:hypothetical protein
MPDITSNNPVSRVRAVRDQSGRLVGFQDPDQNNRFIPKKEAVSRLQADPTRQEILDSYQQPVRFGELGIPRQGVSIAYKTKIVEYQPVSGDIGSFNPRGNQEVIERVTIVNEKGKLETFEISRGLGTSWTQQGTGAKWRYQVSKALGYEDSKRIPTSDLKRVVVNTQYIVKTINNIPE